MSRFETHSHTMYSNLRLLDSINRPKELINKAIELGLSGIAITDHECLSSHVQINQMQLDLVDNGSSFKIALGNEIYLTETRDMNQKYYHFILIAKNKIGHKMLRELSSTAWINSYYDRGMERVPTLKSELQNIIEKYGKGNLIATTACLGGEFLTNLKDYINTNDKQYYDNIVNFINFCKELFEDDFYLEIAPNNHGDQFKVNKEVQKIADTFNLKIVIGTDAHYLNKEDRDVHTAYLNSKWGERETSEFYETAYLQSEEEIIENLIDTGLDYNQLVSNSEEIYNKIETYSLHKKQHVQEIDVKDYPKKEVHSKYPVLNSLYNSNNIQERYWVNYCVDKLKELNKNNDEYLSRLEEEADIQKVISEKLETCIFAYPIFLQHYIDLFWDCGSTIGAGRGSACSGLNHYLLGVTQLDPVQWNLPYFRFLNKERLELPDIDLDLAPSKREEIFSKIKEERGELGCVQVCTFSTSTTRSAIKTACRGYRDEEHPDGIDVDIAEYMASLIPRERGFLWPLKDVVNGNPEKERRPVHNFIDTVNQYPGLLKIMMSIENLVESRSIHASGVVFYDNDPYESTSFMKATNGAIITQFSLHDLEWIGAVKFDFLVTEIQDVITQCIKLLQENNKIEPELSLREAYNKYLHPDKLPINDKQLWKDMSTKKIHKFFQFDTQVGGQAIKKLKPQNPLEMALCNGIMRLMATEKGGETPTDRYYRMQNHPEQWEQEMDMFGLTKEEKELIHRYILNGVLVDQETLMLILMDENTCGFSLGESNTARKIIGKKQLDKVDGLHEKILKQAKSPALGNYIWFLCQPSMSYSFSKIHGLAYSFVGIQTIYLATYFPSVYWNTACLRIDSGLDEDAATSYDKIAKAVGEITSKGIKVAPIDINNSGYLFMPDEQNNQILYGMKALNSCGGDIVAEIIEKRPYNSIEDFMDKVHPRKQVMLSLIKAGAFDQLEENRKYAMAWYLWETCDKKSRVTLQNMAMLSRFKLLPENKEKFSIYEFNRYLKAICKYNKEKYKLDERAINFLTDKENINIEIDEMGNYLLDIKKWERFYDSEMDFYRSWMKENKESILQKLNDTIFLEDWNKYALGNYSHWEMESLCYYYHEHELTNVNSFKYGIVDFEKLPEQPIPVKSFKKGDHTIDMYNLVKIAGTCIAKNKDKGIVTILTTTGVVNVRLRKEQFAFYDRQISEINEKGEKKVIEKSWFTRGNLIMVQGIRRNNEFVAKKYKSTPGHIIYKIDSIHDDGTLTLVYERAHENV